MADIDFLKYLVKTPICTLNGFLKDLKPQFAKEQDFHKRVKDALIDIFHSDGEFSDIEQVCLKFLEEELR